MKHDTIYNDFTIVFEDGAYFIYDEDMNWIKWNYPTLEAAKEAVDNYIDNRNERAWYRSTQDGTSEAERSEQQYRNQRLK